MGHVTWSRSRRGTRTGIVLGAALALLLPTSVPAAAEPGATTLELDEVSVVEVFLDDREQLDQLVELGGDIAQVDPDGSDGFVAQTVIGPFDLDAYNDAGFTFGDVVYTESDAQERVEEREAAIEELRAGSGVGTFSSPESGSGSDDLQILRADYFEGRNGNFLSVEVGSSLGQDERFQLTVERDAGPGTEIGDGGTQTLNPFVDVGVYMYHRGQTQVQERPDRIRVTSPHGGTAVAEVDEWLPDPDGPGDPLPYTDFLNAYMTPGELYERIHQIADEYPDIAEVIELPHLTNGYRRHAQAILGVEVNGRNADRGVIVESLAYGHEGGNDVVVDLHDPPRPAPTCRSASRATRSPCPWPPTAAGRSPRPRPRSWTRSTPEPVTWSGPSPSGATPETERYGPSRSRPVTSSTPPTRSPVNRRRCTRCVSAPLGTAPRPVCWVTRRSTPGSGRPRW